MPMPTAPEAIISQMTKLQQYTYVCAPSPLQYAALAAIDVPMADHVADYRRKRDIVYEGLRGKFEVEKPEGAFYIFPQAPAGQTATEFVTAAVKENLLAIPGSTFSTKDSHFRLSYAASDETLQKGIEILRTLAKK